MGLSEGRCKKEDVRSVRCATVRGVTSEVLWKMDDGKWKNKKVALKFGGNKIITYLCCCNAIMEKIEKIWLTDDAVWIRTARYQDKN